MRAGSDIFYHLLFFYLKVLCTEDRDRQYALSIAPDKIPLFYA